MHKITLATEEDLPEVAELKLRMFAEAGRSHLLAENAMSLVLADYRRMYKDGTAAHFLVTDGGIVLGCAGAFLKWDIPYCYFVTPLYGFIGDVYVRPDARRRGLARRLSVEAIEWLRRKGVNTVRLLTSETARPIYTSLGFAATDEMALQLLSQAQPSNAT